MDGRGGSDKQGGSEASDDEVEIGKSGGDSWNPERSMEVRGEKLEDWMRDFWCLNGVWMG